MKKRATKKQLEDVRLRLRDLKDEIEKEYLNLSIEVAIRETKWNIAIYSGV